MNTTNNKYSMPEMNSMMAAFLKFDSQAQTLIKKVKKTK